jgi:hypothetical protein
VITRIPYESYELLDLILGDLAGDYASADDALAALHLVAERHGASAIDHFSLMRIHDDDQSLVAMESELVRLAEAFGRRTGDEQIVSRVS